MKKALLVALTLTLSLFSLAQQDIKALQASAKNYMQQGDYANATLVLNKALQQSPDNIDLQNDLLFNYYLSQDYAKAMELGKKLTSRPDADIRSYQLLGLTYRNIEEIKECEKLYKSGIKAYPKSGVLYNEYGEFLWSRKKMEDAIDQWEKGIAADPNYSGNYYNAAKYYYISTDKTWALIYGEIFVNLESYSRRTPEIKQILLDGYKKYFTNLNSLKAPDSKNGFEQAFCSILNKHAATVNEGVTTSSLTMLRTRFLLDWFEKEPGKYAFRLFDYQRQLTREGLFDAYNQWLFGATQSLPDFQQWTQQNQKAYDGFIEFQKGRVFKLPPGQNYRGWPSN
ncbi:tetratricopeptide repeat protein [Flavihumibacter profundi]|uniref:tetratricopeptide repeat protein n=1 Tax=Flavihumibacter profundi TaxID=2716883 RepID=UPI001CC4962D|nr:tetratricopeptide repeat protein [Flavihumibacter profundi]MBZ5858678.1 tetratricopeptide repeat protein [Flavihumibacter profundi]